MRVLVALAKGHQYQDEETNCTANLSVPWYAIKIQNYSKTYSVRGSYIKKIDYFQQ